MFIVSAAESAQTSSLVSIFDSDASASSSFLAADGFMMSLVYELFVRGKCGAISLGSVNKVGGTCC